MQDCLFVFHSMRITSTNKNCTIPCIFNWFTADSYLVPTRLQVNITHPDRRNTFILWQRQTIKHKFCACVIIKNLLLSLFTKRSTKTLGKNNCSLSSLFWWLTQIWGFSPHAKQIFIPWLLWRGFILHTSLVPTWCFSHSVTGENQDRKKLISNYVISILAPQ